VASLTRRLVEPTSSLQELEARLNARLLAALLLVLLFMDLVGALAITPLGQPAGVSLVLWGGTIPLLAAYVLSRTSHYELGAVLGIFIFSLLPYVTIAFIAAQLTSELVFLSLAWLGLPILLASLFFSVRITIIYAMLINLSMFLILTLIPDVDRTAVYASLGLVLTVSVSVVTLMYHRKRIEHSRQAALAESEARYRRLAENALDIIYRYRLTPTPGFEYVSSAVTAITGYTPEECCADPEMRLKLLHPDDWAPFMAALRSLDTFSGPIILRWIGKDGAVIWLDHRIVPLRDAAGDLVAFEGIARDITSRRQMEETLRRSEASLAEAQRISHFGSWTWDLASDTLQCSDEMFRIVGLPPQEVKITQEVFLKFLHSDEVTQVFQEILQSIADEPLVGIEHRIVRPNGEIRQVYSHAKVYRDEKGDPLRLVGSTQDITERKQVEAQIERNVRELAALEHMGQSVVASLDLTVVLTRVIEETVSLLGAEGVSVLLIEDQDELVFAATSKGNTELVGRRMPIGRGVAGEVVRTGQPVRIHNSTDQARIHRDIEQAIGFHTQSLLAVPLTLHGEIIGVMEAVHGQPEAFNSDDLRLLEAAARWATVAITNARLFETESRRVQEQAALLEITQMALSSFEFSQPALKHIAQRIAQACEAFQCLLFLLEEQASALRPLTAQYADGHEDPEAQQALEALAAEQLDAWPMLHAVVHERQPHLFQDARQTGLLPDEWQRLFGFKRVLAVPLLSQGATIGLMVLDYHIDQVVDESNFDLALTIGAQIAIALANTRLYAELQQSLQHERDAHAQVLQAEKLAAVGRLAASVAHELNNPLQAIQNSLYLIRQESVLSQQSQDDLDVALTESRRMADLIDRMRETYRPTTATEFRPESLNALITEVEKLISTHLRHNEVTFEFRPNGGRLTVSTHSSPGGLWMTFADTGQGIAPEDLSKIFDPFFTRKEGGTGLGLAISYDIIQHHNGRIEVESQPNQGTTIRIWLPVKGHRK
jgi:PAS domain S-box-containing protein